MTNEQLTALLNARELRKFRVGGFVRGRVMAYDEVSVYIQIPGNRYATWFPRDAVELA